MKVDKFIGWLLLGFLGSFLCLLYGLTIIAGMPPVAITTLFMTLAGLIPRGRCAPVSNAHTFIRSPAAKGLPDCAKPVMGHMVSRARMFGCPPHPDGTPNVVCLCHSKNFRFKAKDGITSMCPQSAQTKVVSRWAVHLCSSVLTRVGKSAGVYRHNHTMRAAADPLEADENGWHFWPATNIPWMTDEQREAWLADQKSIKQSQKPTTGLPYEVFDLDDDEDWVSEASPAAVRPVTGFSLVVAVGAAAVLV